MMEKHLTFTINCTVGLGYLKKFRSQANVEKSSFFLFVPKKIDKIYKQKS